MDNTIFVCSHDRPKEAANRLDRATICQVVAEGCCSKRCLERLSVDDIIEARKAFALEEESGLARSRDGRSQLLLEVCRQHGMVEQVSTSETKFVTKIYWRPSCWAAVRKFLGVGNDLLAEVKAKAESQENLVPRYVVRRVTANFSGRRAQVCEFIASLFRRIGEFMPDSNSLIVPFFSKRAVISYLKDHWNIHFGTSDNPPSTRSIYRYLADPKLLRKISRHGIHDDIAAIQPQLPDIGHEGLLVNVCFRKHQRFGRCQECCEMQLVLAKSRCEADKKVIMERYQKHLESIRLQRTIYYKAKIESIENPDQLLTIIADGPDQYLTRVPHLLWRSGKHAPKYDDSCLPKLKLELVICHGRRGPNIFLYVAPPDKSHGSNMVIESFERTLSELQKHQDLPRRIHVQLDNPTGENKNKYVFGYFAEKISEGLLDRVDIMFLPPSHTHEDVDMRHHQYGSRLKVSEFIDGQQICDVVEKCLAGHNPEEPGKARLKRRRVMDTLMSRETLKPRAQTMYNIRDWKKRFGVTIPRIQGITTAYAYRLEMDKLTGDVVLAYKKTMACPQWEAVQVFIPSGTFEGLPEPEAESANSDKHDKLAAESLRRLPVDCPTCFTEKDVEHAIQLQLGTYPLLPHEADTTRLPRARFIASGQTELFGDENPRKRRRQDGPRLQGTTIVGHSMSEDSTDQALFRALKARPLKYTGPPQVTIKQQREILQSKHSIDSQGKSFNRKLCDLRLTELPRSGTYAFVNCETGLDITYASECPGIAMILETPDWSKIDKADIGEQKVEVQWACVEPKLLKKYKVEALDRGVISPLLDPTKPSSSTKKTGRKVMRLWRDRIPVDSLLAWNIELTSSRMLPRYALLFLENVLGIPNVIRRDRGDVDSSASCMIETVERDMVISSDSESGEE